MTAYSTSSQFALISGLSTTEMTVSDMVTLISYADAEIDSLFNRSFSNGTSFTEYVSVYLPKRADDIAPNRFTIKHYPVQSITEFILVDSVGTTTATLSTMTTTTISSNLLQTANYFIEPDTGLIEMNSYSVQFTPSKAKITGTYGYETVPTFVSELSAVIASIRGWVRFLGGNYNRLNKYSLPEQSYDKGDFSERGRKTIDSLTQKANDLKSLIGEKYKSQFFSTSGGYF